MTMNTMTTRKGGKVCPKCGTMLGQKNICPVCNLQNSSKESVPSQEFLVNEEKNLVQDVTAIDEFLLAHLNDWEECFDDFYDNAEFSLDYRGASNLCDERRKLLDDIQSMLEGQACLSKSLALKVMDEIPRKHPEISENQARQYAKRLLVSNQRATVTDAENADRVDNMIATNAEITSEIFARFRGQQSEETSSFHLMGQSFVRLCNNILRDCFSFSVIPIPSISSRDSKWKGKNIVSMSYDWVVPSSNGYATIVEKDELVALVSLFFRDTSSMNTSSMTVAERVAIRKETCQCERIQIKAPKSGIFVNVHGNCEFTVSGSIDPPQCFLLTNFCCQ